MATKRQLINNMKKLKGLPPYDKEENPINLLVLEQELVRDINYSEYFWCDIEEIAYAESGR